MELLMRDVVIHDSEVLREWRNEAEVRKFSRHHEVISVQQHSAWLGKRLNLIPSQPFWMFDYDRILVGFTRFDFDSNLKHFKISITINPLLRGKGFGKRILSTSIEKFLTLNSGVDLYAEAHEDNKASRLIFLNCGFREYEPHGKFLIFKRTADSN
jgi:RimJ/RimL family protein N-acetyltransferase